MKMMTSQRESLLYLKHTPLDKKEQKRKEKHLMETTHSTQWVDYNYNYKL